MINKLSRKAGVKIMFKIMTFEYAVGLYMQNQRGGYVPSKELSSYHNGFWILRDEIGMIATVFEDGRVC